jgi:predicted Fe-Mo cluster-binding NifX family protein
MRVAIAVDGQVVAQHFGHAPIYRVYRIENDHLLGVESLANPGHRPGVLPAFLNAHGIEVMIAGGMGESALKLFEKYGITVYTGISGYPDRVIDQFLAHELTPSNTPCEEHGHHAHHEGS